MSKINDGGPAFPEAIAVGPAGDVYPGMGGMSLRDWFAGQALAGYIANAEFGGSKSSIVAVDCYGLADAMLKAREGGDA